MATSLEKRQETAKILFRNLQETKVVDKESGEETPVISSAQKEKIAKRLLDWERNSQAKVAEVLK